MSQDTSDATSPLPPEGELIKALLTYLKNFFDFSRLKKSSTAKTSPHAPSPLPSPKILKEYLSIPEMREKLIEILEDDIDRKNDQNEAWKERGQWFAFAIALVAIAGGCTLAYFGQSLAGCFIACVTLITFATAFLVTKD